MARTRTWRTKGKQKPRRKRRRITLTHEELLQWYQPNQVSKMLTGAKLTEWMAQVVGEEE